MTDEKTELQEILLEAPVKEVTLLEDRGQVVREGRIDLPRGRVRVKVEDVAPVMADKTLALEVVSGPEGLRSAQVRVVRELRRRSEHRPEDVALIEEELRKVEEERGVQEARERLLDQELEGMGSAGDRFLDELSQDVSWGRHDPGDWSKGLQTMRDRIGTLRAERLAVRFLREDLDEKARDLRARREALLSPAADFGAAIEADLVLPTAGPCTLRFQYIVPGACWRPQHTARLLRSEKGYTLRFQMDGCVWQNTGESWDEVRLLFSTQRPSLGTEPPLLASDLLHVQPKPEHVVVEARDRTIETTGLGGGAREAPEVPGIDDAGESLTLAAKHTASVPSDGRPSRAPIMEFTAPAEASLVCYPELARAVILKCTAENASDRPLLAGPVDLALESGFVGRTSALYVAPGEKFEIGFGPDPELRVHRRLEEVPHEKGMLSKWVKTDHTRTLTLSNIGAEEKAFDLTERIPVSEVEQVKIVFDPKSTVPGATPDENGFVTWKIRLEAGGTATHTLRYVLEKHHDVAGI